MMIEELIMTIRRANELSMEILRKDTHHELDHGRILLLFMLHFNQEVKISDIADHFGVTSGAATGIVDRLEQKGLVKRVRSLLDRRIIHVILTEDGEALVEEMKKRHIEVYQQIIDGFCEDDLKQAIDTIQKLSDKLVEFSK